MLGIGLGLNKYRKVGSDVFSPINISDIRFWLDAGQGVTLDGSLVDSWTDQSTNGYSFLKRATDDSRPIFIASVINGLPALQFTDALEQGLVLTGGAGIGAEYDIFIVAFRSSSSASSPPFGHILSTGVVGTDIILRAINSTNWNQYDGASLSKNAPHDIWHIFNGYRDSTTKYINIDNATPASSAKGAGLWGAKSIYIGGIPAITQTRLVGYVAEIICYNRVLNSSEKLQIHTYLEDKYAI